MAKSKVRKHKRRRTQSHTGPSRGVNYGRSFQSIRTMGVVEVCESVNRHFGDRFSDYQALGLHERFRKYSELGDVWAREIVIETAADADFEGPETLKSIQRLRALYAIAVWGRGVDLGFENGDDEYQVMEMGLRASLT